MDEILLKGNTGSLDVGGAGNVADETSGFADIPDTMLGARRQLPEIELVAFPRRRGLEDRAEASKHIERLHGRSRNNVEPKIDLQASPAAKFLLQLMPWELTPPFTPVTSSASIPFIWEDVPGRPKPLAVPSSSPSLPLPPRLLVAPPPSSPAAVAIKTWTCPSSDFAEFFVSEKHASISKSNPSHGRTHWRHTHAWHALHSLFSGGFGGCSSHAADALLEAHTPAGKQKNLSVSGSTSVTSDSSSDRSLSHSMTVASEDVHSIGAHVELPSTHVPPVTLLTLPHGDLGPLQDRCGKQSNRLSYWARLFRLEKCQRSNVSRTRSLFNLSKKHGKVISESNSYLLDDATVSQTKGRAGYCVHRDDERSSKAHPNTPSFTRKQFIAAQLSPIAAVSLYRSPQPGKPRIERRMKVLLRLRRRGARVIVASYRAVKRALFLRRVSRSKVLNFTQFAYHTLSK